MSFTDDYLAKKKKKKKTETTGHSFTDEYNKLKPEVVEDIAPVSLVEVENSRRSAMGIAPIKAKEEERTWFKTSSFFDDGYQFGDVTKTILGTARDVGEHLVTGVVGMGEKILDAGMMLGAAMNESRLMEAANQEIIYNNLTGNKEAAESTLSRYQKWQDEVEQGAVEFTKKDLYDEREVAKTILLSDTITDVTGIDPEKHSVLGDKSDSLVQSAGQLGATAALQAVGVPWWLTTGATSYGAEAENALNQGATFDEANLSATISAGAEILTEKLSGGIKFGGKTLDDVLLKPLTEKISNKVVKALVNVGIDAVGEGGEEIVSQVFSNLGSALYKEEDLGTILFSEEAFDEYAESFIGGAVLGGIGGSVQEIKSNKSIKLTENEQKVVDKVFEDRVAEEEQNGKKLTNRDKNKIYNEVLEQMDKGYISTDTIEEVLGGEAYKSYKDTVDSEDALQAEFDTLNKMKQGEMTGEQIDRRNELKQQLKDLETTSQRNQLKTQLSDEVFGLTKDSRLVESYNERARRGQAFEADLTQYDAKQQETIKKAVESGILNNTNRTHEFVDMVAKISADKGVLFDFTNNAKLKESSFAVDGKIVNGYFDKKSGTIGVNIDSAKAVNTVVGHEITHVLEGTEVYDTLKNTIVEYAKTKGDYQGRIDALNKLYDPEDVDTELVADLVGDYLFTDKNFIHKLSTENRNIFQKIYDEIKYLCKVATAGSKEARELERVKKAFEDAYRAEGQTAGDIKHSITESPVKQEISSAGTSLNQIPALFKDKNVQFGETNIDIGGGRFDQAKNFLAEQGTNSMIFDPYNRGAEENQTTLKFLQDGNKADTATCANVLNVIAEPAARSNVILEAAKSIKPDGTAYFMVYEGNGSGVGKQTSAGWQNNRKTADYVGEINEWFETVQRKGKLIIAKDPVANLPKASWEVQPGEAVRYSLSDSDGNTLSKDQSEYFKDSKVRDENGNLKVMYHGTPNGDFTVFKDGTYFTENKEYADKYQNPGASSISTKKTASNPKTYEVYLDIKKPFDIADAEARRIYIEDYIKGGNAMGINPYLSDAEYDKITTIDWTEGEDLREFLTENGYDYDGLVLDEGATGGYGDDVKSRGKSYVVFSSAQVKNTDNLNPTDHYDIRYSLSDSEGKKLSKEQQDYFKDSKMRDENGNLKVMYHGSQDAGFHVFDAKMSDDKTSFFFVDRNDVAATYSGTYERYAPRAFESAEDLNTFFADINKSEYAVKEENGKYTLYYEGDNIAENDTAQGAYEDFCDYEGVGYGDANYKVYLNLTNPLVVDAEGRNWDNVSQEYSQELYEQWKADFTEEEKAALVDLAGWEDYSTFKTEVERAVRDAGKPTADEYTKLLDSAFWKHSDISSLFSMAQDNFSDEVMKEQAIVQYTTRDFAQKAKEQGYDGVIFKNIVDNGEYSTGSEGASTVAIAFDSNQIKSVANDKPTADPDIRFSLSESVEETKDLMALHNLKAPELLKSLELGGFPMPSIAVIKADAGHEQYGDVSLVFPKETIDPQKDRANKVYGGDAWTPTYPRIEYKPNESVEKRIREKYYDLSKRIGFEETHKMARYVNELEDSLNRSHGEAGLLEDLYNDRGMMQIYLQDIGKGKVEDVQKEIRTELSDAEVEMNEFFIKELGADVVDGVMVVGDESPATHRKQYWEEHGEKIKEAYQKFLTEKFGFSAEEVENVFSNMKMYSYLKLVRDAHLYRKNGRVTVKTEKDFTATDEAIGQAAGEGYKDWIDGLFKGVEEKTGIRNNADYFTPSGNRRKWEALHWENTLENVVRVMKQQDQTGADAVFGVHKIFSTAAKEYGSIADIKADSHRLHTIPQEEYESIKDSYTARMQDIATRIMDKGERNEFIAMDNAMECIVDAVRTSKTKAGILRELKQYRQLNVTDSDVDDIVSLVNDIANMPTGYFEAKPQRAVGFDEVAVFVIPRNADVKLKQELLNRGYNIAEYDPDVEGDRQKVVNQFEEYKFSLSNIGEAPKTYGKYNVYGKDIALEKVAPVSQTETAAETAKTEQNVPITENVAPVTPAEKQALFPDNLAPIQGELEKLYDEQELLYMELENALNVGSAEDVERLAGKYDSLSAKIRELEAEDTERVGTLDDSNVPPEMEAPYYGNSRPANVDDPFADRDWDKVGNRKVKAYMYENPEVKPFFQEEARVLLGELDDTTKGERWYDDKLYYESGGEKGFGGVKRFTSRSMETLLDSWRMSYADIEKGLKAIIEDNGAENIAAAKKIEFMLNDRLLNGYKDFYSKGYVAPNQDYINLLNEKQINEYSKEAFDSFMQTADQYAPIAEDATATVTEKNTVTAPIAEKYEAIKPKPSKEPRMARATPEEQARNERVAKILFEPQQTQKQKSAWKWAREHVFSHGAVFEDMSLKTGNRALQAKFDNIRRAESAAQYFMGKGEGNAKALVDVRKAVEKAGKTEDFNYYLYHLHNVDRMTLEQRFKDVPNKSVFGDSVDAEASRKAALGLEVLNPEFKQWAAEVYSINRHLRQMMVDEGVISQETADLWQKMYPHYVPISRADAKGLNVNVPLDTKRTGVNAPIKKATGGNSDFYNVFDTMGSRIEQTYKAIAKNRFGVELMGTLGTAYESDVADIDTVLEAMDQHEDLLQEGKNGESPSFTVFQNGERVKFAITEDMYDSMKPSQFTYTNEALRRINDIRRDILTTYSPTFALTNPIKDVQDILLNSQHPMRTYATIPEAIYSVLSKNHWYQERMKNGGNQDSYFDGQIKTFKKEDGVFKKVMGFIPSKIQAANEIIEQVPRMAEYIASRKMGRSIDVSMLDAARVTTNFGAAGDLTNMLNRNGFTFLGASVEGFNQQVRNVREAKAEGVKGVMNLAAKYLVAGLPALLLNHALWDDDEEYEELSDYVKQNYYVVAKTEEGKFIRIPKGRAVAVIQDAFKQMENLITGNDEADWESFGQLLINNLAPNNPLDNNLIAPLAQAYTNKTWYGDDLVPTRLQDVPVAEQFDETTDSISKWLGEATGTSPYKWNYVLDQYTGGIGDMVLPYLTKEADGGGLGAAFRDKFVTDPVLKNQNVTDFYTKVDELTVNANSSKATDEDILKYKYINSVNADLSELYKQKREVQNSDLADDEKYSKVKEIQQQIDSIAKESLATYEDVNIDGIYATVGDLHYRWHEPGEDSTAEPGWQKITDKQLEKQEKVTSGLGISPNEYWGNKEEYDFAYENPEKYAVAKSVGGYTAYKDYSSQLNDIKGVDNDGDGRSDTGTRKEKVIEWVNNLDADYGTRIILFKNEYNADDTYNYDIIEYLNGRDDISYEEMETILKELGFDVSSDGTISWD